MAEPVRKFGTRKGASPNVQLDWAEVHRRMASAQAAAEQGWQPAPEEVQRILRNRAKELAREAAAGEELGEFFEVVDFVVAHEKYAIESRHVREVVPVRDLTPIPCVPHYVLGVINLRGRIVSVIDIKRLFELPEKGLSDLNKAIIVRVGEMELGILADSLTGSSRIRVQDLQPSLPTLTEIRAEFLKGVTGGRRVVLDAEKILSDPKLVVHDQVEP